jgi:hypothetical protein
MSKRKWSMQLQLVCKIREDGFEGDFRSVGQYQVPLNFEDKTPPQVLQLSSLPK